MVIDVFLKPNSKFPKVVKEDSRYTVFTKAKPFKGKANAEMIELLSEYLDVSKTNLELIKGFKSREKKVKIAYGRT